jgi:hypothetical protein
MDRMWPRNKFGKTPTSFRLLPQLAIMECFLKPKIMLPPKLPWTAPALPTLLAPSMAAIAQGAIKVVMLCYLRRMIWRLRIMRAKTIRILKARMPIHGWKVLLTWETPMQIAHAEILAKQKTTSLNNLQRIQRLAE